MKKHIIILLFSSLAFTSCAYNKLVSFDENIKAQYSEILNQYKRRADLIPNLVNTVKGYAKQEKETLTQVIEARSRATGIQATPELLKDPKLFQNFNKVQGSLSSALSRLMVVVERYPNLKADQQFLNLQAVLEGTENRITVARKRYIDSVKQYNIAVRSFPSNITARFLNFEQLPNFTVENEQEIQQTPDVDFNQ